MTSLKEEFSWAIPKSRDEKQEIWENAILTVDANVLLDLYRVHKETRESIIENLSKFQGRLWLSHQVATEFFKNRNQVIVTANKTLNASKDAIINIKSELNKLIDNLIKNYRGISQSFIDNLRKNLEEAYSHVSDPYLEEMNREFSVGEDEILDKILDLFNDNLGHQFTEVELEGLRKEGNDRIKNKTPPGYKDNNKDGDGRLGDFFLWKQILSYSKDSNKPIIFITGDKKEDWWEICSGETCGLRPELQKEFKDVSKQSILIYTIESFLHHMQEKATETEQNSLKSAIRDIRDLKKFDNSPVVIDVNQWVKFQNKGLNLGKIECVVTTDIFHFTVTGQLQPRFNTSPHIKVKLIKSPTGIFNKPYAKTGTLYDFNIHLKATEDTVLPKGNYVFEYVAYEEVNNSDMRQSCAACGGLYLLEMNECFDCKYSENV